jgi:glycosyltransferase involved in cell wall biosynthesis
MTRPFCNVGVDTYNHERLIEPAIVSVLERNASDAKREIIVVDDGSYDRAPEIVRKACAGKRSPYANLCGANIFQLGHGCPGDRQQSGGQIA